MNISPETGILSCATYNPSPNQDERPANTVVDLLVIHCISLPPGVFGGSEVTQFFLNQLDVNQHRYFQTIGHLKVSSHLVIRRDGEVLQFVPFHKRAWHAGESSFQGRQKCNDFSIGIELEGLDTIPFTQRQYAQLIACTQAIRKLYPAITLDNIVGHADIAPGRKTDPGPLFEWQTYRDALSNPALYVDHTV